MSAAVSLIRDVFRQARATGLTATLLGAAFLSALACLTVQLAPTSESQVEVSALFGSVPIVTTADRAAAVSHFQFLMAGVLADNVGILLTLVWTASFLPSFLEPHAASVLLVKPPSRARLFLARFLGVVLYVATAACIFVAATWLSIGVRTDEWSTRYWICVPLIIGHFAVFFAFSALLAVMSRNTTVCIVGALLFWALCWGMNYGRHILAAMPLPEASMNLGRWTEFGYWVLPKPLDFSLLLSDWFGVDHAVTQWLNLRSVTKADIVRPAASIASSMIAGAVLLGLAIYEFIHDEY